MTMPPHDNDDVLARIGNPVVDAWNDAPADAHQARLSATPARAAIAPPAMLGARTSDVPLRAAPIPRQPPAPVIAVAPGLIRATAAHWKPVLLVLAVYACLSGAYDLASAITPGKLSSPNWRFGVVGAAAPVLVKPVLGFCMITFVLLASHRKLFSQVYMWLLVLSSVAFLAVPPIFLLDAIQIRPVLPSHLRGQVFLVNVIFAVSFLVLSSIVLVTCAVAIRKAVRDLAESDVAGAVKAWDR